MSSILRALLLALALMALALTAGCGGGGGGAADTTAPVGSLEVTGGTVLSAGTAIVIAFNESMDTGTLVLDGTLEPSAVASWADSSVPAALAMPLAANDTLTLQPTAGTWPTGFDQTLTVNVKDTAGNSVPPMSFSFDIFTGLWFVHPDGDDAMGDGSAANPYATIQGTIDESNPGEAVLVAAGTFESAYNGVGPALVTMVAGVSLYGGYSATDWSQRDPATHVTTLRDTSTTGGSYSAPNRAVTFPSTVNVDTDLDGFVVEGGGGGASAAIVVQNNANIRNNVIRGGAGGDSLGVKISNSGGTVIASNTIDGGTGSSRIGIDAFNSDLGISANSISGGTGAGAWSYAIYMGGTTAADITDNTLIDGGGGASTSFGFYIEGTASPTITGNTMIRGGAATANSYGIWTASTAATPPTIANNTIDGGSGGTTATGIRNSAGNTAIEANTITVAATTGTTYGIHNYGSAPTINGNSIDAGSGAGNTAGIYNDNTSSPVITNNTIYGGSSSGANSFGVWITDTSAPTILNNTIESGAGFNLSTAIRIQSSSTPIIKNNIVFTSASGTRACVVEIDVGSDPAAISNNDLFACGSALYTDADGAGSLTAIADVNDSTKTTQGAAGTAGGNVSVDPLLADFAGNDWHFRTDGTSPCAVTQGADGIVSLDKDGNARPGADSYYSMGAYEYDGACAE